VAPSYREPMIDIHSHILPGLDDGSPDAEESLAMLRQAAEAGTTDIVATPHSDLQFAFDPVLVEQKIAELAEAAGPLIRIHYGCDFHLHYENVREALADPSRYAINHKTYLLVEVSELMSVRTAGEAIARLLGTGIYPILTHPERNRVLQQHISELERWVAGGCRLQITAQSLIGDFGRKARTCAFELLRRRLVDFVASDAHDSKNRTPRLDAAYAVVAKEFGSRYAQRLFETNPAAVLAGEPLPESEQEPPASRRPWWRFWG